MAKRYILALDQGTTSTRAMLVDVAGRVAGMAQEAGRKYVTIASRVLAGK